jgi:hypothetical protein
MEEVLCLEWSSYDKDKQRFLALLDQTLSIAQKKVPGEKRLELIYDGAVHSVSHEK